MSYPFNRSFLCAFIQIHWNLPSFRALSANKIKKIYNRLERMNIPCNKMFVWSQCCEDKSEASESNLEIAFDYSTPAGKKERIFMVRKRDDQFGATKQRLGVKLSNLSKPKDKKSKKTDSADVFSDDQIPLSILILDKHGKAIGQESATNFDVFQHAKSVTIGENIFEVVQDAPRIEKLAISVLPIVDCPVIPSCDWRIGCSSLQEIRFEWYVSAPGQQSPLVTREGGGIRIENWSQVHSGEIFCPREEHDGMQLCLAVLVRFNDEWLINIVTCKTVIQSSRKDFVFKQRQLDYCSARLSGNRFRLMSYNILADLYLNLRQEKEKLFFSYCPKEYQESAYRYPVVMKELEGYNADLIFLQEVDYRLSFRFLTKFLQSRGFSSTFKVKEREVNEGLMIAFRSERLRMVQDSYSVRITDLLDENPENADIVEYLKRNPVVKDIVAEKPNVLQVVHLETVEGKKRSILACNTHLAFDPMFENVKLVQALLCCRYISKIKRQIDLPHTLVLFSGDFNSTPDSAVARLMQGGSIKSDDVVWGKEEGFSVGEKYDYSSLTGFPKYTNFTKGFSGCLDYMWKSGSLICEQVVPMPDHELVTKYEAIPSKIAPSDHLPIICDADLWSPEL